MPNLTSPTGRGTITRPHRPLKRAMQLLAECLRLIGIHPKGWWIRQLTEMTKTMKTGSKPKFATYQKTLERKAEEVRNSMSAQKAAQVVARLDIPSDEGDLSQQSHEEWIFLNRNTIDMKLLREVSGALHRIDTAQYGVCMQCEEDISPKRLEAVPWARYCVVCQEQ